MVAFIGNNVAVASGLGTDSRQEAIRNVMDEQDFLLLSSGLESRIDMKMSGLLQRVAEAEHSCNIERHERETAMVALQQDMLTLTDSAVKERGLIEGVLQDVETLRSEQSQVIALATNVHNTVADVKAQRQELADMIEKSVAEICAALALKQHEEMTKNHQLILQEFGQRWDSAKGNHVGQSKGETEELDTLALLMDRYEKLQKQVIEIGAYTESGLEAVRADVQGFSSAERNKVGELCSNALAGWEEGHTENLVSMEQKLESFRDALTSHISEVQDLMKETISDLHAERDDRRICVADLRASLTASMAQSTHRIELLESDLIDITRALKRLDQRVRDCARTKSLLHGGNTYAWSERTHEEATSSTTPLRLTRRGSPSKNLETLVSSLDDIDPSVPLIKQSGLFGSLLEAANVVADEEDIEATMESSWKSRMELIKRAANSNPGLSSILRRARELGEVN